jgi:hypothetical protein
VGGAYLNIKVCATHHVVGRRQLFDPSLNPGAFTLLFTRPAVAKVSMNKAAAMATP